MAVRVCGLALRARSARQQRGSERASGRRPRAGQMADSTAMTVAFLRARLLSERSVSRAAKERADELAKRVRVVHAGAPCRHARRRSCADGPASDVDGIDCLCCVPCVAFRSRSSRSRSGR